MMELGGLGSRHIYLQLLYTRWYDRMTRMGVFGDRASEEDRQMLEELRQLPEQLSLYQKQIRRFFELVLDVDSAGRDPQQQASQNYLYDAPKDPVFKAYRKEYKRRFAWIRAGRISDTDFYAWSEQAREMKKRCDQNIITLEEYVDWLKHS